MLNKALPEIQLALSCMAKNCRSEGDAQIRAWISRDIDWEFFEQWIVLHKLLPVVYRRLAGLCPERIPEKVRERLAQLYFRNVRRSLLAASRLLSILDALNAEKVQAIPFKGPVLADMVYGDMVLRQFSDLDILISLEAVGIAVAKLIQLGLTPEMALTPEDLQRYAATEDNLALLDPQSGFSVELHWDLLGGYGESPVDFANCKAHLQTVAFMDREVLSLRPEAYLVYLCRHGAQHGWRFMDMVCSVSGILDATPQLDWALVQRVGLEWRCTNALLLGLVISHDCFGTNVPLPLLSTARDNRSVSRLLSSVLSAFARPSAQLSLMAFQLATQDSLWDRILFLVRFLTRPTKQDWRKISLPGRLWFFRYGLRPLRLLERFAVLGR